jgi:hypothetical protein
MKSSERTYRPMPDHDRWPVFVLPWDDNLSGPTDMSHLLEKPAGATGFIRIVDGHLATGDGRRWRIWGQNLTFGANLPPTHMAPTIARRLSKYGINCIRLHHMDRRWPQGVIMRRLRDRTPGTDRARERDDEPTRALDPEALARLDYFMACCKGNGVYIDLNLNVSRMFTEADGVVQPEWIGYGKALTYFDPTLIALQKEYAAQLLDHVNPFTGNRYAEEPAIALIELVNENSILESWVRNRLRGEQTKPFGTWGDIPPAYAEDLDRLWNHWLARRHRDRQALIEAWQGDLGEHEDPMAGSVRRLRPEDFAAASKGRFADEATFYAGLERDFFVDIAGYLRGELGARQIILGTSDHNHGINGQLHVRNNSALGIVDGHCYWQHPRFPGSDWSPTAWTISNTPMVDAPDHSAVAQVSRSAVEGMPYILSEINEPFPNDYAAEYIPIMAAYALLQDWDGLFWFCYGGGSTDESWVTPQIGRFFSMANDPVKMAETAIGALMFLRGDVQAARQTVARCLTGESLVEALRSNPPDDRHPYSVPHLLGRLALVHRTAIAAFDAEAIAPTPGEVALPEGDIVSDTGELVWSVGEQGGLVWADTPLYQAIIGHGGLAGGTRTTSNMGLELETPFAAVQLISLDGAPIAQAGRLLLVTGARVANTGMRWLDDSRQSLGDGWGEAPTRIEPVVGTLSLGGLEAARRVVLEPLDGCGQPTGGVQPFERQAAEGIEWWELALTGDPPTPWYLIAVER